MLSGTGSDGTLGLQAVKEAGGLVMAQDPESTEFDGMPRSAIATGLVDYVLPPSEMPSRLIGYVSHAFADSRSSRDISDILLRQICVVVRDRLAHDFSEYKRATVARRVERRMALHHIARAEDYLEFLERTPAEVAGLFRDLLIGVTSFFRDPEAFAVLEEQVLPALFDGFNGESPPETIRVWVCACSTGEEAYSIAILAQEQLERVGGAAQIQIFATDIDPRAIEKARSGVFPASIAADISPKRLANNFLRDPDAGTYRIRQAIRDLVVFSEQDVIKDPPFSRLHLISCRNLLIYLDPSLQKKLIPLFHYALRPEGTLWLGTSESVGEFTSLFAPLDRKWKLYTREDDQPGALRAVFGRRLSPATSEPRARGGRAARSESPQPSLRERGERALLEHYVQAGLLVTARGEILQIYGRTGSYLEPSPGEARMNVTTMARDGLRRALTTALHKAVATRAPAIHPGLQVATQGPPVWVDLTVTPADLDEAAGLYLILFESPRRPPEPAAPQEREPSEPPTDEQRRQIAALEQELAEKEEYLQTTLEEMETSNEELKSANEELQSVNEELQSTNEELETSKEELQSVNEELQSVNAELQAKVVGLSRANNDMSNLLAGTGVGTLFVDLELRITRFTPAATEVINLIQSDVGRPVSHIASNLIGYDQLVPDIQGVVETLEPKEVEVQTARGRWFLMRIRPYRTLENVIEGAVLTLIDVTARVEAQAALRAQEEAFQSWFESSTTGFALLEVVRHGERVECSYARVNPAFEALADVRASHVLGLPSSDDVPGLEAAWLKSYARVELSGEPERVEGFSPAAGKWLGVDVARCQPGFLALTFVEIGARAGPDADARPEPGA